MPFKTPETPQLARIEDVKQETENIKTFTVKFVDAEMQKKFFFVPGKFMMVSIFGFGEMPISISSSPYKTDSMQFTVMDVGSISHAMHMLGKGSVIGLRGPFGNGFPLQKFRKKNIVFVGGGCGFAPLRSAVYAVSERSESFGKAHILFGCKSPEQILFKSDLGIWEKACGLNVLVTVDEPTREWGGCTGAVTKLFDKVDLSVRDSVALICGPPVMIHFSILELKKRGFKDSEIYASLERLMHCGVGYCSHCNIGGKLVCIHGPIFNGRDLNGMHLSED